MKIYVCALCGYKYSEKKGDEESGIMPGTDFEDIPDDWVCPQCAAGKEDFDLVDEEMSDDSED